MSENRKKAVELGRAEGWFCNTLDDQCCQSSIAALTALLKSVQAQGAKYEREKVVRFLRHCENTMRANQIEEGEHDAD